MLTRVVGAFTENWGLKLAAAVLALLLWAAVTANEPERTVFRNVPVEVDLGDPQWRLDGPPEPENVAVVVEGPRGQLMELSGEPLRIVLPVDRVTDSIESHVVPLQWVQQQIPAALGQTTVRALRPDTIRLTYERLASRTLPVRVRTRGQLPDSLRLATPVNTNPSTVEVRGPASLLGRLDSVPLFPVDLAGLRSTTNVPVAVDTTDLEGLAFDPTEVNVVLRVVPADSVARQRSAASPGAPFR